MPSYVVRKNITQQTAEKMVGKIIRITFLNKSNKNDIFDNCGYFCNIGPIYNIIPFKIQKSNLILIFYLDNENDNSNEFKWVIYTYEHIEIPKNPKNYVYNILVHENTGINGTVPSS